MWLSFWSHTQASVGVDDISSGFYPLLVNQSVSLSEPETVPQRAVRMFELCSQVFCRHGATEWSLPSIVSNSHYSPPPPKNSLTLSIWPFVENDTGTQQEALITTIQHNSCDSISSGGTNDITWPIFKIVTVTAAQNTKSLSFHNGSNQCGQLCGLPTHVPILTGQTGCPPVLVRGLRSVCSVTFPPFNFSVLSSANGHINNSVSSPPCWLNSFQLNLQFPVWKSRWSSKPRGGPND